jgi:NADH-quinone oxidoreductase subunit G
VHGAALALAKGVGAVKDGWNGFDVVHFSAARMGALMLGYSQPGGINDVIAAKPKLAFFLGADDVDFAAFDGTLKVYVGHHGDKGAHAADVILPAAAWTEKDFTTVNTEGRVQRSDKAVFAPGDAREDWSIFRALADALGVSVGFDSFAECRAAMVAAVPELGVEGLVDYGWPKDFNDLPKLPAKPEAREIPSPIKDFYLTNAICRASPTMQRCSDELLHGVDFAEAAE